MIATNLGSVITSIAVGLALALFLKVSGALHTIGELSWVSWLLQPQGHNILVVVCLVVFGAGISIFPKIRLIIRRLNNTEGLPGKPFTPLHSLAAMAAGVIFGGLIISPRLALNFLAIIFEPSARPASVIVPALIVLLFAVLYLPETTPGDLGGDSCGERTTCIRSLTDDPISNASEDLLARGWFVDRLKVQLQALPKPCRRFVMAIDGGWGDGKTSAMNLLLTKIHHSDEFLVVRFNPWLYDDDQSAIRGFFNVLDGAINSRYFMPSIRALTLRYAKLLGAHSTNLLEALSTPDDIASLRMEIESVINQLGKRIVVFVDDLDRIEYTRLMGVFRLVNLLADFPNLIFILALDRNQVRLTLNANKRDFTFVEKIVQRVEPLPRIPQSTLDSFIDRGIGEFLDFVKATKSERLSIEKRLGGIYQTQLRGLFPNLRAAKEFLGGVYARVPQLRSEVDLVDLILLEVLHSRFSTLYADVWPSRWQYVTPSWSRSQRDLALVFKVSLSPAEMTGPIKTHVESIIKDFPERVAALEIVKTLFPQVANAYQGRESGSTTERAMRDAKRVCHPDCLRRAFEQVIEEGELPDSRIESLLAKWDELPAEDRSGQISAEFVVLVKEGLIGDFIERLIDRVDSIQPHLVAPLFQAILSISGSLTTKETIPFTSQLRQARNIAFLLLAKMPDNEVSRAAVRMLILPASLEFSTGAIFFLLDKSNHEHEFRRVYALVDALAVQEAFKKRAAELLVLPKRDIFDEDGFNSHLAFFNAWAHLCGDKMRVHEYLELVVGANASSVVKLLRGFYHEDRMPFEYASCAKLFDAKVIYTLATKARDVIVDTKAMGVEVLNSFIEAHERHERARIEKIVGALSMQEKNLLKAIGLADWQKVELSNQRHARTLFMDEYIEKVETDAAHLFDPRTHFGARITVAGREVASKIG